ncbi:hypothetical protein C8F04DRAFT_1200635 [Mycena alexandri]|uniref:Uncharacterized protein n=1 Tax=Mycena alexandri TaxID=1745969 RepID=A0AAD6WQP8_9AGAR|nr:hypothetical protein C8F04DRAFT_1200635 [Mycena alexandri]
MDVDTVQTQNFQLPRTAANAAADSITVSEAGIPKAHKVLLRGKDGHREAVFTVIGAIINKAFPPVNSASVPRHRAHLAETTLPHSDLLPTTRYSTIPVFTTTRTSTEPGQDGNQARQAHSGFAGRPDHLNVREYRQSGSSEMPRKVERGSRSMWNEAVDADGTDNVTGLEKFPVSYHKETVPVEDSSPTLSSFPDLVPLSPNYILELTTNALACHHRQGTSGTAVLITAAQENTVGGLGDATFGQSIKNLDDVCYKLSVQFPEGSVDNWAATTGDHGETLKATCRYFTMGKNTPAEAKVPFASNVDPQKVLEKLTSESISHREDNDVDYLEWKNEKLIRKNPVGFRVGDIVQVGISVCTFRASKVGDMPRYMCKLVLRSVTLLDVSMTRRAQTSRLEAEKKNPNPTFNARAFKRTWARIESDSEDDELPTARQKMSNLTIEDVIMNMNEGKQDQ